MATINAADLLVATVNELAQRAPAVIAAAAAQLGEVILGLHFDDGSHATLQAQRSRLLAQPVRSEKPGVEAYFDARALNLLFDLARKPVQEVMEGSLDVRGSRPEVLAVWRVFGLLAQRAAGLRSVQDLWRQYRDQAPEGWGRPPQPSPLSDDGRYPLGRGWKALEFLDQRYPEDQDRVVETTAGTVRQETRSLWDGHTSRSWWSEEDILDSDLLTIMQRCKNRVQTELMGLVPEREPKSQLYDLMRIYPSREGKGLRPTLIIAACCAFGGRSEDSVRTAAAIELFHNAFLVHDDIADESTHRRNGLTLHNEFGVGLAVNTGDAMNLLAIDSVLSNLEFLGLARTLGLIHEVVHMCRESLEGQAIELGWIRQQRVPEHDEDYFLMSFKKTGWYTCISPCRMGAVCAGETDPRRLDRFNEAFRLIGIAFQIQDDVLNLVGETALYGKEPLGDLLEGKRTIMLIHLFRTADPATRRRLERNVLRPRAEKTQADALEVLEAMKEFGSLEYAIDLADRLAHQGVARFEEDLAFLPESEAKGVLRQIANYVTTRPL